MKNEDFDYNIFTDGGSRGNPGEASYGFVVYDKNSNIIYKEGKRIGVATNNVAEYKGIISALKWVGKNIKENNLTIQFCLDSLLVVSQLNGVFKVKDENLRGLYFTTKEIEKNIKAKIFFTAIRREYNKEADKLVNLALDGELDI